MEPPKRRIKDLFDINPVSGIGLPQDRLAASQSEIHFPDLSGRRFQTANATSLSKHKTVIQIENPLPGGSSYTSPRRARWFFSIGRAIPVGPFKIRFVHDKEPQKQLQAEVAFARRVFNRDLDMEAMGGKATVDQIQGLPCVQPIKLIRDGKENFTPRALKRGPVHHLFSGAGGDRATA